jgi:hypothetical protein
MYCVWEPLHAFGRSGRPVLDRNAGLYEVLLQDAEQDNRSLLLRQANAEVSKVAAWLRPGGGGVPVVVPRPEGL